MEAAYATVMAGFDLMDTDGNGLVDLDEFRRAWCENHGLGKASCVDILSRKSAPGALFQVPVLFYSQSVLLPLMVVCLSLLQRSTAS